MDRKVSHFKLGLFILVCSGLIVAVAIWLGLSYFFEETRTYATYLDESARGLQEDAVVNYRGLAVGRVVSIRLAPDGRLIEILMGLRTDFNVAEFMAVQLREQGLTGLRHLEIDTAPENMEALTPKIDFPHRYPVIPAIPSEFQQLKTALETLYGKIVDLDAGNVLENLGQTLAAVTKAAQSSATLIDRITGVAGRESLEESIRNLGSVLKSTRDVAAALEKQVAGVPPGALANLQDRMTKTVTLAQDLFSTLDEQVNESSVLMRQTLQQFNQLVAQLNTLVETIQRQPNRLIFPSEQVDPFER